MAGSAVLLGLGALAGLTLWRWRLLSADRAGAPPIPGAEGAGRLPQLRLEAGVLLASGVCVWLSQSLGAASARALFGLDEDSARAPSGIALTSGGALFAAGLAAGLCLAAFPGIARTLGVTPPYRWRPVAAGLGLFLLVFPVVVAVGHLATLAASLIAWLTGGAPPDLIAHETLRTLTDSGRDAAWWFAVIAVVVGAPLAEEFVYRGCLQSALERLSAARRESAWRRQGAGVGASRLRGGGAWGWWPIALTSLIFAAAHVGVAAPQALVTLFALSLAFGAAYRRTGRLVTPVVMHSLFNALNIALAGA